MNSWSPVFSKIIDSSIWLEPDHVRIVWITMLAKKDSDHVVRANAFMIASWSKKTEAEVLEALKVLSSPDKRRLEPQPFGGRRIERVDDGWLILNGQVYEEEMRKTSRRIYQARKQREYRERAKTPKRGKPGPGESLAMRVDENGGDTGAIADEVNAERLT